MGTRSVVGILQGDSWKGRYVHFDGYPTGVGYELAQIIKRDGVERATQVLTEDYFGWSSIDSAEVERELPPGYSDGRFANVPGYGTAYTVQGGQSNSADWISPDTDDWGTEWAYVITPKGLAVLVGTWDDTAKVSGWVLVGGLPYDAPLEAFAAAEHEGDRVTVEPEAVETLQALPANPRYWVPASQATTHWEG